MTLVRRRSRRAIPVRDIIIDGDTALIPLTLGLFATIDVADAQNVSGSNWFARIAPRSSYARRYDWTDGGSKTVISLHRQLMGVPDGLLIDHIDGDGLNNRRSNLRIATHTQNAWNSRPSSRNTSGVKGVYLSARDGRWVAQITTHGKRNYLGRFDSREQAAAAYAEADLKLRGAFAHSYENESAAYHVEAPVDHLSIWNGRAA